MAKWYYAKMHVAVGGYIARPGEVIEGDFSKEDIAHWLRIGAIAECGEPEGVPYDDPTFSGDSAEPETGNPYDEEPAPAQIDVMDGVTPAAAPAESAAPKTTRKARGGKTK